ncbi:MAG: hypothetical protein VX549_00460 [Pseudomonadota bacterium]|nr:hypothetical protein [Pseudomonadota bacterium]
MFDQKRFAQLHLKADVLERHGLPDIGYPVPPSVLPRLINLGGELPFPHLLLWIQQCLADATNASELGSAVLPLCRLIGTPDAYATGSAQGDDWILYLGEVDLSGEVATIQKQGRLLAAASQVPDSGDVLISVYEPLAAGDIHSLIHMGGHQQPNSYSGKRSNWDYTKAQYATPKLGNAMQSEAGHSYRSYWERGLGIGHDGEIVDDWYDQRSLWPLPPWVVATQLGVWYELAEDNGLEALDAALGMPLDFSAPPVPSKHKDSRIRQCQRVLRMVHELHKSGYQHLRISCGMVPSGLHWRCQLLTANDPRISVENALYSSAQGKHYFEWADAAADGARELAAKFIQRFPRLCETAMGRDWRYVGWYSELLGWVEAGYLPVEFGDYGPWGDDDELVLTRLDRPGTSNVVIPAAPLLR